ncbi:hypothetical protein L0P85_13730 [Terrisporobacter glycolicus]|nr:hypothetical protein L0P85_13730 [Terrisporobacter glycolicus]
MIILGAFYYILQIKYKLKIFKKLVKEEKSVTVVTRWQSVCEKADLIYQLNFSKKEAI